MRLRLPRNLKPEQIDRIIAELNKVKENLIQKQNFVDASDLEKEFIKAIIDEVNRWQEVIIDRINKLSHKTYELPRVKYIETIKYIKAAGYIFQQYIFPTNLKKIEPNILEDLAQINAQPIKEILIDYTVKAYVKGYKKGVKDTKKQVVLPDEYAMSWIRENALMVSSTLSAEASNKIKSELYFGLAGGEGSKKLANRVRGVLNKPQRIANEIAEAKAKVGAKRAIEEVARRYGATTAQVEALAAQIKRGIKPEKAINALGIASSYAEKKSELIAISETAKAVNSGRLDAYEDSKVVDKVEIIVAVDERTCPTCMDLEGEIMTIEEARAAIPVHPRCRCLLRGSFKIFTSKGWLKIKDIKMGDLVLTHKGRFRKVKKILRSSGYKGEYIKVSIKKSRTQIATLSTTLEHPFYIYRKGKYIWVEAKDLNEEDRLIMLANKCKYCGELIPISNLFPDGKFCSFSCNSKDITRRQWSNPKHRENVSSKLRKTMRRLHKETNQWKNWIEAGHRRNRQLVKEGKHFWQQPETHCKAAKALGKNNYGSNYIEQEMGKLLKRKGLRPIAQYPIQRKLKDKLGRQRYYFADWALPDLKIDIECDGEYWHNQNIRHDKIRQKEIEDSGWLVLRYKANDIKFNSDQISKELDAILKNHNHRYHFVDMTIHYIERKKLKKARTRYNLEVEEDQSYIASGFVIHNCTIIPIIRKR